MGRTIRLDASKETKIADARSASTSAAARGGLWGSLAAQRLGPILTLFDGVEADLEEAEEQAATLIATRDVERGRANDLIGRTHDQLWNDVGRPGHDPAFALIFPGGIGYYVECDVASQPKRMLLLAKLLTSNLHPMIDAARGQAAANEIRTAATALRQAVDAAEAATLEVELHDQVGHAISRSAAMALARLKKLYKAEGFAEADIHEVIPSRPRTTPKKPTTATQVPQNGATVPSAKGG